MGGQQDDAFRAEPGCGQHGAQTDRTVADHRDRPARGGPGGVGRVVAGAHHVGQREQGGDPRVVRGDRCGDQGAVGERDPGELALAAVDRVPVAVGPGPPGGPDARGRPTGPAGSAHPAGAHERRDDQIAGPHGGHLVTDVLDHADELVPDPAAFAGRPAVVPQVGATDAARGDPDQGVGRGQDARRGHLVDADVAGAVQDCCLHVAHHARRVRQSPDAGPAAAGPARGTYSLKTSVSNQTVVSGGSTE